MLDDIIEHTAKMSSKQKCCVTLAKVKINWTTLVNHSICLMSHITNIVKKKPNDIRLADNAAQSLVKVSR